MSQVVIEHGTNRAEQKQVSNWVQSFCMSVLGFIMAVVFHQLLVYMASIALGYETTFSFGKVELKPFDVQYWSNMRVVFIYALPTLFILTLSAFLVGWLLRPNRPIKNWYLVVFWFITFSVLYLTAEMTIAPVSSLIGRGTMYQGMSVMVRWFDLQIYWTIALVILALLINISFAYFGFKVLYFYRPSSRNMYMSKYLRQIVSSNFIYPLLLLLPLAVVIAYPDSMLFFVIMLLHGLAWLPGFFIRSKYLKSSEKRKRIKRVTPAAGYVMLVVIVLLIIALRLFI